MWAAAFSEQTIFDKRYRAGSCVSQCGILLYFNGCVLVFGLNVAHTFTGYSGFLSSSLRAVFLKKIVELVNVKEMTTALFKKHTLTVSKVLIYRFMQMCVDKKNTVYIQ